MIQVHGHRGCRGLFPENTLEAFQHALEIGVDTLEMDLCISKDLQVVVSHEPWLSHEYCLGPQGKLIQEQEEKNYNLYRFPYEEIRTFDCGSKPHPRFPRQQKIKTYKPLLREVTELAERFSKHSIHYNIEIKYTEDGSNLFHPELKIFCDLVMEVVYKTGIQKRTLIQCFDANALNYVHQSYPEQTLSYLVETKGTVTEQLKKLNFVPQVYSPDYTLLNEEEIRTCQHLNMKVIPWTINNVEDMKRLLAWKVDGIITDYPDTLLSLLQQPSS